MCGALASLPRPGASTHTHTHPRARALETNPASGWLHPTINLTNPDEGVDTRLVCANEKQQHAVKVALSNSFGFGGHNSCVLFSALR